MRKSKTLRLAHAANKPQYFQHLINRLEGEQSNEEDSQEEITVESPILSYAKKEIRKEGKRRKAVDGHGLLD